MLYGIDKLKFLHPVGVSTLQYGVTIPLEAQTERLRLWLAAVFGGPADGKAVLQVIENGLRFKSRR